MFVRSDGQGYHFDKGVAGADRDLLAHQNLVLELERYRCRRARLGGIETYGRLAVLDDEVDGGISVCVLDAVDVAEGVPVLRPGARLIRLQPTVVGLIVGVCPHHQLDVWTVLVGKKMVFCATGRAVTPGPELLAWDNIVVGDAHYAGVLSVIVAGEKIVLVVPREHRVGVGVILVPADIDAGCKVRAVELGSCDRPRGEFALAVIGDELRAGGKNDLVGVVDVDGYVGKAEHRGWHRRPVDHAERSREIGLARIQRYPDGPFHAIAQFQLTDPDCLRAVNAFLNFVLHR